MAGPLTSTWLLHTHRLTRLHQDGGPHWHPGSQLLVLRAHARLASRVHLHHVRKLGDALEQRLEVACCACCEYVFHRVTALEENQQQRTLRQSSSRPSSPTIATALGSVLQELLRPA